MKNTIQHFLKIYLFFLFFNILSCDNCPGGHNTKFRVVGLDWHVFQTTFSNTFPEVRGIENNSVVFDKYSIEVRPNEEFFAVSKDKIQFPSFINAAYACDIASPTTEDKIDKIEIFSDKDFNSELKKEMNLEALFDIIALNSLSRDKKMSIQDYISSSLTFDNEILLLLKESPGTTQEYRFTVVVTLERGTVYEFTTNPIEIKQL